MAQNSNDVTIQAAADEFATNYIKKNLAEILTQLKQELERKGRSSERIPEALDRLHRKMATVAFQEMKKEMQKSDNHSSKPGPSRQKVR